MDRSIITVAKSHTSQNNKMKRPKEAGKEQNRINYAK